MSLPILYGIHTLEKDIESVDRVQMRATRLVPHQKHLPYIIRLKDHKLHSLARRRINCAPLVADLFLFCYERDLMLSLSDNNQTDIIEAFNSTSRYVDDLHNIDNSYFEQMVGQIYPTELQLTKANASDSKAPFSDLNLSISNDIVSSKIMINRMNIILKY